MITIMKAPIALLARGGTRNSGRGATGGRLLSLAITNVTMPHRPAQQGLIANAAVVS